MKWAVCVLRCQFATLRFALSSFDPALRQQGNEAFTQGDYETAVRFYTEGLDQLRDMQALYTNRASTFHFNEFLYNNLISQYHNCYSCETVPLVILLSRTFMYYVGLYQVGEI